MIGRILSGRYRLLEKIGTGGMAVVYRAQDQSTEREVAIKLLRPEFNTDTEFVKRFQREAEAARELYHNNIVNLLDVGMDGEDRYLVMEYVPGQTLKQIIAERGHLAPSVAVQITVRILSALQHAHSKQIIHRDIKPQNVLIHREGHVKVADFGIARMAGHGTLTRNDAVIGSVHYFSPEQAVGSQADVTSDIYSVGITLYEMLTGRVPFEGDTAVAIAMQHVNTRPTPIEQIVPNVPAPICKVCMRALEKKPQNRYQSAYDMAMDLQNALAGRIDKMLPAPGYTRGESRERAEEKNRQDLRAVQKNFGALKSNQKKRKRSLTIIISSLSAVIVFLIVWLAASSAFDQVVNTAMMPDFYGLEIESARRLADKNDLKVEFVEINHATIAAGTVVMQMPEYNTTMRKGDTVVLTISKGPSVMTVPYVVGMTTQAALNTLQAKGLNMTVMERVVSQEMQADFVLSQMPEAMTSCMPGDMVQVIVSGGSVFIPDVTHRTLSEAQTILKDAGLAVSSVLQYVDTVSASLHGTVASQLPLADTQVVQNSTVALTVYRVEQMLHKADIVLDLPITDAMISVRITLAGAVGEYIVYQGEFPADAGRHPVVTLKSSESGEMTYKVYYNDKFAYQHQVTVE